MIRPRLHRRRVKRVANPPRRPPLECQRGAAVDDPVGIEPLHRRKPCVPVVGDKFRADYRHRIGPQVLVQRLGQAERVPRFFEVCMGDLPDGVDPRVGAPGALHGGWKAGEAFQRLLQPLLDGRAVGLTLPAREGAAVIFEGELVARHDAGLRPFQAGGGRVRDDES